MSHEDVVDDLEAGRKGPLEIPYWHEYFLRCTCCGYSRMRGDWVQRRLRGNRGEQQLTRKRIEEYYVQLEQTRHDILSGRTRRFAAMIVALVNIAIAAINVHAHNSEGLRWALASSIGSTFRVYLFFRAVCVNQSL